MFASMRLFLFMRNSTRWCMPCRTFFARRSSIDCWRSVAASTTSPPPPPPLPTTLAFDSDEGVFNCAVVAVVVVGGDVERFAAAAAAAAAAGATFSTLSSFRFEPLLRLSVEAPASDADWNANVAAGRVSLVVVVAVVEVAEVVVTNEGGTGVDAV
jgi:hypothetical protein